MGLPTLRVKSVDPEGNVRHDCLKAGCTVSLDGKPIPKDATTFIHGFIAVKGDTKK